MSDLVSIIVPVYKVENYLDRCVRSLIGQTYSNLEIILVDDGSPDQCPQKCDQWAALDERIKVIHKANGGLSDARNAGIAISSGKYISFVDSDDFVDSRFVECLYSQILGTGSQIACVGVVMFNDEKQITADSVQYKTEVYARKEAIAALLDQSKFQNYAWNKMYQRTLFESVQYPFGKVMEDLATAYRLIEQCDLLSYCPVRLYYYFQRTESIVHNVNRKLFQDWYFLGKERYLYIKEKYPDIYANHRYFNCVIFRCYPMLPENEKNYANREFRKNFLHYDISSRALRPIIKGVLFLLSKRLYCFVWRHRVGVGLKSHKGAESVFSG